MERPIQSVAHAKGLESCERRFQILACALPGRCYLGSDLMKALQRGFTVE
jgi:hypothetical protein